jgi:hypothetical protein
MIKLNIKNKLHLYILTRRKKWKDGGE